jgi:selenide,water dikinase
LDLQGLFSKLEARRNENLLVGFETSDDAAIYRLSDESALVITADFITPFMEDPYLFGAVAAANSLSDVYAMGGKPITALNLCMFPVKAGVETLSQVLRGGLDKIHEAGAILVGGHTVKDDEMKYGLAVNGLVHPRRYTPNSGIRAGDVLLLTKPVGTGVYVTGSKQGLVADSEFRPIAEKMSQLNKVACETMMEFGAAGATDITGFGLGGHALGMARASRLGLRFFFDAIPKFPRTLELLERGLATGLSGQNRELVLADLGFEGRFTDGEKALFWDPQTSGGLLFGIQPKDAPACLARLKDRGIGDARIVGESYKADRPGLSVVRG